MQRVYDLAYRNDRISLYTEILIKLLDSSLFTLAALHAVYRHDKALYLYVSGAEKQWERFSYSGSCSYYILSDEYLVTILKLVADHAAALAVVLLFLAVKAVAHVHAVLGSKRYRRCDCQRDALVRRSEKDLRFRIDLACVHVLLYA